MSKNPEIIMYTKEVCPYCVKAKKLLQSKGLAFKEIDITNDEKLRDECFSKANGRKTVPQIFINNIHIGGCDDLYEANTSGKLAEILG